MAAGVVRQTSEAGEAELQELNHLRGPLRGENPEPYVCDEAEKEDGA